MKPAKLEEQLIAALGARQLAVHFQPQYELSSGGGFGVEALARWTRSNDEEISLSEFIPVAERRKCVDASNQ